MAAPREDKAGSPWTTHRRRATVLCERLPFAAEILSLYLALLDVWDEGWGLARENRPAPSHLPQWTAGRVLPMVVKATEAAGPEPLASATRDLLEAGEVEGLLAAWLAGEELSPVEGYLARASLRAPLLALDGEAGTACADDPSPRGGRRCPHCAGPPQLSFRSNADEPLVSGRRHLLCARCGQSWSYSSSACPSCGETAGSRRTVYSERRDGPVVGRDSGDGASTDAAPGDDVPMFPHIRIDACATCERYVIDVDLSRDSRAVPEVDELAAVPLDLYAAEHGLSKITPNLMGF